MGIKQLLRRPYYFVSRFTDRRIFEYRYLRRSDALRCESAVSVGETADDEALVDRVIAAYLRSQPGVGDSIWTEFFRDFHADIDHAFRNDRAAAARILRDPKTSDLFYGFDNLCKSLGARLEDHRVPGQALDGLLAFAEALGIRRLENPEAYRLPKPKPVDPDDLLSSIDRALGVTLPVPNPYRGHYGLKTRRGVVTYRVPQAMYQAWRVRELTRRIDHPRVLEIGGGLGLTALYANTFGIRDYTIVDIPISAAAQRYFLGRVGIDAKLLTPEEFFSSNDRYDLIVNIDSLTELDRGVAEGYVKAIRERCGTFLSINHENNAFTVRDLFGTGARHPYWLRRGYVDEVFHF